MNSVIYDPLLDYESKFKDLHAANTDKFLEELVKKSGIDIEKNRQTVKKYNECRENLSQLRKKRNWLRFFRVLMCITLLLIPLVIWKITPKIKELTKEIDEADQRADKLLEEANNQMAPLNDLFTDKDALTLTESTIPLLSFAPCFSVEQEADMKINYDFGESDSAQESSIDVLAGSYNGNPFLFENKRVHRMGTETYHGYKTIRWTETYRDSNGKLRTRTRSQTLHATVTKPKPFYTEQIVLNYCAQGAPELSFSRDDSHLEGKSEKGIERYVKRGERKLNRKAEKAVSQNDDFVSMSNSEFEVIFDALDRTHEVQFRTLFTPLAQTNMVKLMLSPTAYADDFDFIKKKRTNTIISAHSQSRRLTVLRDDYTSYSYDEVHANFTGKNAEFFRAVYFDFAPLWAIPLYQERPVHSLKPIPDYAQMYSLKECESLANAVPEKYVVHPNTKTQAILKSAFVRAGNGGDETCITAYSYDIAKRVDVVSVLGGDGRFHNVTVPWDEYLPLETENRFFVSDKEAAADKKVLARRNGLCIFNL